MSDFEREPMPENWGATDGRLGDSLRNHHKVFFRDTWPDWIVSERSMSSIEGLTMRGALQDSLRLGVMIAERMGVDPKDACITSLEMRTKISLSYLETVGEISSAVTATTPFVEGLKVKLYVQDPRADISPAEYTSVDLMIHGTANLAQMLQGTQNAARDWAAIPADDREKCILGDYLNAGMYMVRTHFGTSVEIGEDFRLKDED